MSVKSTAAKEKEHRRHLAWNARNKKYFRERDLRKKYDLSPVEYEILNLMQDGKCAICGDAPKTLAVDHDHGTGCVRGLLCLSCNAALGALKDSPDILRSALTYLLAHKALPFK